MKKIAVYPGSFDPITYGHLDLIERSSEIFDEVYVVIAYNPNKNTLFSLEERLDLLKEVTKDYKNVKVDFYDKLIVDYVYDLGARVIVRGLRAVMDFEYEMQMASTNSRLKPEVETLFMMTKTDYSFLSSSVVKEVAKFNGDVSSFVPKYVEEKMKSKFN